MGKEELEIKRFEVSGFQPCSRITFCGGGKGVKQVPLKSQSENKTVLDLKNIKKSQEGNKDDTKMNSETFTNAHLQKIVAVVILGDLNLLTCQQNQKVLCFSWKKTFLS